MNIRDCHRILKVPPQATLEEVKTAFRKLAFSLHPDLNPAPDAAERFRELNEAYILLSRTLKDEPQARSARAGQTGQAHATAHATDDAAARKAQAGKAYAKSARAGAAGTAGAGSAAGPAAGSAGRPWGQQPGGFHLREEEVLRDLLTDPFARQVFEDIYSQLKNSGKHHAAQQPRQYAHTAQRPAGQWAPSDPPAKRRKLELTWGDKTLGLDLSKGIVGGVKSWLRGHLDDEQSVTYPAHAVGPGKLLRLTVTSRFGEPKTIEITLPPDFVVGRPVRLRGLGRKLGPFTGDLYLRVFAR